MSREIMTTCHADMSKSAIDYDQQKADPVISQRMLNTFLKIYNQNNQGV